MYVNTMNLTVSLTLMMFRLHAQFQVNSEGSLQLSVVHSMMIPVPCATCGGETEKRVYPDVTNAEHVPKCTRPALPRPSAYTGSKVIRYVARGGGRAWERG